MDLGAAELAMGRAVTHLKLLIAARDVTMLSRYLKMTGHSPLHEK
jgi:hypothetical protein